MLRSTRTEREFDLAHRDAVYLDYGSRPTKNFAGWTVPPCEE